MGYQNFDFKKLYEEKKYSEIISIIENFDDKDLNSGLINLCGACKLLSDKSTDTLKSAISDFRKAYLREKKKTEHSFNALKNFINASIDLFDIEFRTNEKNLTNNLEEIFLYFEENKEYFKKNESLTRALVRALIRNLDIENAVYYLNEIVDKDSSSIDAWASYIYFNNYIDKWDQKKFLESSKILDQKLIKYPSNKLVELKGSDKKKINLGFHTADIRAKHSVTHFLKTILTNYNKDKFNINLYLGNKKEDQTTNEFKEYVNKATNITFMDDIEVINLVRNDKIDILFDLMGLTSNHRLSLYKNRLAPIQISWCGYLNTTGLKEMDYMIADRNIVPQEEQNLYSEKIIYLDDIWNCHAGYELKRSKYPIPYRQNKFITFGSFNNFNKINDSVIAVWSKILKKIENSKLILKSSNAVFRSVMAEKFEKNDVLNSIEFISYKGNFNDHLNEYKKIDIALDTFPHNGVTTSFEAIWMGVPVLTMKGFNFSSRCGESINKNINLNDLIANNKQDYVDKAIFLSENIDKIEKIRNEIYENALGTPLFDQKKFVNHFFTSLEKLYN